MEKKLILALFACYITSISAMDEDKQTAEDLSRMESESSSSWPNYLPTFSGINSDVRKHFDELTKNTDLVFRQKALQEMAKDLKKHHQEIALQLIPAQRRITSSKDADLFFLYGLARTVSFRLLCKSEQEEALVRNIRKLIDIEDGREIEEAIVEETLKRSLDEFNSLTLASLLDGQLSLAESGGSSSDDPRGKRRAIDDSNNPMEE